MKKILYSIPLFLLGFLMFGGYAFATYAGCSGTQVCAVTDPDHIGDCRMKWNPSPYACSSLLTYGSCDAFGCVWDVDHCDAGTISPTIEVWANATYCSSFEDEDLCTHEGGFWYNNTCNIEEEEEEEPTGVCAYKYTIPDPFVCATIPNSTTCDVFGCTWDGELGSCSGTIVPTELDQPTYCSAEDNAEDCNAKSPCFWYGGGGDLGGPVGTLMTASASGVGGIVDKMVTNTGTYLLLFLVLAGITIPLVFMRKGLAKIWNAIRLRV